MVGIGAHRLPSLVRHLDRGSLASPSPQQADEAPRSKETPGLLAPARVYGEDAGADMHDFIVQLW